MITSMNYHYYSIHFLYANPSYGKELNSDDPAIIRINNLSSILKWFGKNKKDNKIKKTYPGNWRSENRIKPKPRPINKLLTGQHNIRQAYASCAYKYYTIDAEAKALYWNSRLII